MNLLDRIKSGSMLLLIPILFACQSEEGLNINIDNVTNVSYVEFELPLTNIRIDSLRTDDSRNVLVGSHIDDRFAELTAKAYSEFVFDSGAYIADTLSYDSMVVTLKVDQFLSESDEGLFAIETRGLTDSIFSEAVYLSNKEIEEFTFFYDTIDFQVSRNDTAISFEAPRLGRVIYSQVRQLTEAEFNLYTNEFALLPSDHNELMLALEYSSEISHFELFTRDPNDSLFVTRFRFNNVRASNLKRDRSSSYILSGTNDLDTFNIDGGQGVISPAQGLYTVADMKEVTDFLQENRHIVLNSANIEVVVDDQSANPVESINYFAYKPEYGIRGEGTALTALSSLSYVERFGFVSSDALLTNPSYVFGSVNRPELIASSLDGNLYTSDVTLAMEHLHLNYYATESLEYEKLVLLSTNRLDLNETNIKPDGVKIKLFYTEVN